MQLDRTHVAIRVRTLSEIGDLALLMIRRYPVAFFPAFFIGALPWIVLNAVALWHMTWPYPQDQTLDAEGVADYWRAITWAVTLAVVQVPIAGVFSTYYLGQAVFEQRPTLGRTIREVLSLWWPVTWTLGIKRLAIPITVLAMFRIGQPFEPVMDQAVPFFLLFVLALVRGSRPFVPEMVVLERCPIRSKSPDVITLRKRSKALHSPMTSELASRFLVVSFVLAILAASVFYTFSFVRGVLFSYSAIDALAMNVMLPLALWLAGSLSVIVRLLAYLDTRIRLEGWEVELAIRAEALRQFGEDGSSVESRTRSIE